MKRIGPFIISRDHEPHLGENDLVDIDEKYAALKQEGRRLVLGTLPARSGTMWLCDIFNSHENATGITERNFEAEAFYRWITYNNLPVDTSGHIALIKHGIIEDWKKKNDLALVYSPFFSHGILELDKALDPFKWNIAINDPEFTVQSIYNKKLFHHYRIHNDPDKAYGYQPSLAGKWSFMFGRLVPQGNEYIRWSGLTRVGKVAWWANRITLDIFNQIRQLPREKIDLFELKKADQNYTWYQELADRYELHPLLSEKDFLALKWKRVKKTDNVPHEWSAQEQAEFEQETKEYAALQKKVAETGTY